jgi:hypothetical protein
MPSVPWWPVKSCLRFSAVELLRSFLPPPSPIWTISPVGSTTCIEITLSRVWPKRAPSSDQPPVPIRPPTRLHG